MNWLNHVCVTGIKLSKLANIPLKVGFLKTELVNALFSIQILTSQN